jgi:hypothetical protein
LENFDARNGIERNVQVAIQGAPEGHDATFDSSAFLEHLQPFLLRDVLPQERGTVFWPQLHRLSWIAKSHHQEENGECRDHHRPRDP